MSQDSENAVPSLKGSHSPNPGWHRSADSGFASTDVDPNSKMITTSLQQQTMFSDQHERSDPITISNGQPSSYVNTEKEHLLRNSRAQRDIDLEDRNDYESELNRTDVIIRDTWNKKEQGQFDFNHIYNTTHINSPSSQNQFLRRESSKEYTGNHKYSRQPFGGDDRDSHHRTLSSNTDELSQETSFIADVNANVRGQTNRTRKEPARPPSFSEVPLPPAFMLNNTTEEDDTENVRIEVVENDAPISPTSFNRKLAFQSSSKNRGKSF